MEFNRCNRCGSFYVSEGNVCPKCANKDSVEFSTFVNYIQENGFENSLENIAGEIGISVKNLNRFIGYQEFQNYQGEIGNFGTNGESGNNGITFN